MHGLALVAELAAWSMWAFFLLMVAVQLGMKEVGYRFGLAKLRSGEGKDEGVGLVSTSVYGLLAFALAFNLSMASTRFGERRDATLQEANAIGTLWLQATALDHPRAQAIAEAAKTYIALRQKSLESDWNAPEIEVLYTEISALQTEMWGQLIGIQRDGVTPQTVQLEGSMNAMFDATTTTRFAVGQNVPGEVVGLLFVLTLVSMTMMGYQFGLFGHPHRILSATMILVWSVVLMTILDLGSARLGDIRVSTAIYAQTASGFGKIAVPAP